MRQKACKNCGDVFETDKRGAYLCPTCSSGAVMDNILKNKREYQTQYIAEHTEERAANRSFNKVCVICGKVFDTYLPTVTCSPECDRIRRKIHQDKADIKRGRKKYKEEHKDDR